MTPRDGRLLIFENPARKAESMTEHSLWRFSRAFHRAINDHQTEDLAAQMSNAELLLPMIT